MPGDDNISESESESNADSDYGSEKTHLKLHLILDYQSHSFTAQSLIKIANDNKLKQLTALINTVHLSGHREHYLFLDSLKSNNNVQTSVEYTEADGTHWKCSIDQNSDLKIKIEIVTPKKVIIKISAKGLFIEFNVPTVSQQFQLKLQFDKPTTTPNPN